MHIVLELSTQISFSRMITTPLRCQTWSHMILYTPVKQTDVKIDVKMKSNKNLVVYKVVEATHGQRNRAYIPYHSI